LELRDIRTIDLRKGRVVRVIGTAPVRGPSGVICSRRGGGKQWQK